MGSRSASYPHTSRSIYKPIFLIHPLFFKKEESILHTRNAPHAHTIPATHAFPSPSTDQTMTTVVARSDCKVSDVWVYRRAYRSMLMCTCLIWVRMDVFRTWFSHPFVCLCKQVWVLQFMQVKKIVQTQKEMRKYLVKVHRCYITDRLHHRSKQRVIALSKYPSTIHVYLRDVHISPPYLDNNVSVALKPARK